MSLLDYIKNNFSSELISEVAMKSGESEASISKSIRIILPAILGNLIKNSDQKTISEIISKQNSVNNRDAMNTVFVNKQPTELLRLTVEKSGISYESAHSVLEVVINKVLELIGNFAHSHQLENSDILKNLEAQKPLIPSILPAGISMSNLGLNDFLDVKPSEDNNASIGHILENTEENSVKPIENTDPYQTEKSFWNWLLPLILLGIAAWYFWKVYEKQTLPEKTKIEIKK